MRQFILVFILLMASPSYASTWYVDANAGSDTIGSGASAFPWQTIQRAVTSPTPVVAGDTILVRDGDYSVSSGSYTVRISTTVGSPSGSVGSPITIKSENYLGAVVHAPSTTSLNVAFEVTLPYYIIEGFDIDGGTLSGNQSSTSLSYAGVAFRSGATGGIARRNHIHDIGRDICSDSVSGFSGVFIAGASGNIIEYNEFNTIGRLFNGETGPAGTCTTARFQNDHAIYIETGNNTIIRRNVVWDTARGFAINLFRSGQSSSYVHTNVWIQQNTFDNPSGETRGPCGQIIYGQTQTGLKIENNIFSRPETSALQTFSVGTMTSTSVIGNRLDVNDANFHCGSVPAGITVGGTNVANVAFNFSNHAGNDYTLTASSTTALNTGESIGLPFDGSAPEIGAYEVPEFTSCQLSGDFNITVVFSVSVNPPLLPSTGAGTFTARKNGSANAIVGAGTRIGDNEIGLIVTNVQTNSDTGDISGSTWNITDSAFIGGSHNQKFLTTLTNQSCVNNVSSQGVLTQAAFELHSIYGSEEAPVILPHGWPSTGEAENYSPYPIYVHGRIRIRYSVTCTIGPCADAAYVLYYSTDGGASYAPLGAGASPDPVGSCGTVQGAPPSGAPTTNQLSTPGTFRPGGIVFYFFSIPTVTGMTTGDKTELEYCVRIESPATGTIRFRVHRSSGAPLNAYTYEPVLQVEQPSVGGMGF